MDNQTIVYKYFHDIPCACFHCGTQIIVGRYSLINGKYTCDVCSAEVNKSLK